MELINQIKSNKGFLLFSAAVFFLLSMTACNESMKPDVVSYFIENDQQSELFKLKINEVDFPVTVVPNIDSEESNKIARQYEQLPPYTWVESRYITVHYAHIAINSSPEIEIDIGQPITEFTIYPRRLGVKAQVAGSKLHFTAPVEKTQYLLVRINELPMFVLIAEALESNPPKPGDSNVVNLEDFKEGSIEVKDYTDIFREAVMQLNGTGKTLYIPKGQYVTDEIQIRNCKNFSIHLAPGALIRTKISPDGENVQRRGIWIDNSENIRIYGRGSLDHQGYENFKNGRNDYQYGFQGYDFYFKFEDVRKTEPFLYSSIMVTHSKKIDLEGITVRNGRIFNITVRHCDDIAIRNLKVLTPAGSSPEWTDGIGIGSTQNLLLDSCFVYANDDPFSTGHNLLPYDNRGSENFLIRNSFFWNPRANGTRIGWALNSHIGDIIFENCDFAGNDDSAFIIHSHQASEGKEVDMCYPLIRFKDCTFDDVASYTKPLILVNDACIKSLELINVVFDATPQEAAVISGHKENKIQKLLIENVTIGGEKVTIDNFDFETKNIEEIIVL